MLAVERLKFFVHYDPKTGVMRRIKLINCGKVKSCNRIYNNISGDGYLNAWIENSSYLVHRLTFLYMTGVFPKDEVDHINGNRTDNRWKNLRQVTRQENTKNTKRRITNSSGLPGVYFVSKSSPHEPKWTVEINGEYLGFVNSFFEACCIRKSAERNHKFHINHGRRV